jgi:hypothetical protein
MHMQQMLGEKKPFLDYLQSSKLLNNNVDRISYSGNNSDRLRAETQGTGSVATRLCSSGIIPVMTLVF